MIQTNGVIPADKGKKRKLIRKQVVSLLKNKTDVGKRVFPNASIPIWEKELPVILIFPRSEPATEYAQAPKELNRDLDLAVEIVAKGPEVDEDGNEPRGQKSLQDILDDIAEQVEDLMSPDTSLGGTADESSLTNTEFEFESIGGVPIGSARLTFEITYKTFYPRNVDKQGSIEDFKKSEIEYNIGADPLTREAKDSLDIPQT